MLSNDFKLKLSPKYSCEFCDYITSKKSNIDNHLKSKKHEAMVSKLNSNGFKPNSASKYLCENCGKEYKDNSGLWRHKKKCNITENIPKKDDISDKELIMMLINENKELKTMMMEQQNIILESQNKMVKIMENGTTNNSHNTTTNSHNKAFNLNFFLNETCKDAMNITDFVDSIKLQLDDLIKVGEIGYVEGISNIITKNLKALDVTQRPIHCTDKKREVLYVKDEDKWEKEDDEKKKMRRAIKKIASKNQRLIPEYKKEHPDYGKSSSKTSDQYNKIIVESMGGSGDNDLEKEDKIIKNISKVTTID